MTDDALPMMRKDVEIAITMLNNHLRNMAICDRIKYRNGHVVSGATHTTMLNSNAYRYISLLLAMGVLIVSCGSNKKAQCTSILNTIEDSRQEQQLGDLTRAAMMQNADVSDQLADQLNALDISNQTLQEHTQTLIQGHRDIASSTRAWAEMANAEGRISYRSGDTQTPQVLDQVQTDQRKAHMKAQLGRDLIVSYCAI